MKPLENFGPWWLYPTLFALLLSPSSAEVDITQNRGITTFWFNSSNTQVATFIFDLCKILPCTGLLALSGCPRIRTETAKMAYICVTSIYWGDNCDYWGSVGWNYGTPWGYQPSEALNRKNTKGESLLKRMTLVRQNRCKDHFILNIRDPQPGDAGTYFLGGYGEWGSPRQIFLISDMYHSPTYTALQKAPTNPIASHITSINDMTAISDPTFEDVMTIETGSSDHNLWLEWMKFTADKHNQSNCYACSKARPHLGTVPLNIPLDQEDCFLSLYNDTYTNNSLCESWKKEYPILSKNPNLGNTITIYPGNYTCYLSNATGKGVRNLGKFPQGYCSKTRDTYVGNHTRSLGDIFWICGDMRLRTKIDTPWKGECALAKIITPFHFISEDPSPQPTSSELDEAPQGEPLIPMSI